MGAVSLLLVICVVPFLEWDSVLFPKTALLRLHVPSQELGGRQLSGAKAVLVKVMQSGSAGLLRRLIIYT